MNAQSVLEVILIFLVKCKTYALVSILVSIIYPLWLYLRAVFKVIVVPLIAIIYTFSDSSGFVPVLDITIQSPIYQSVESLT